MLADGLPILAPDPLAGEPFEKYSSRWRGGADRLPKPGLRRAGPGRRRRLGVRHRGPRPVVDQDHLGAACGGRRLGGDGVPSRQREAESGPDRDGRRPAASRTGAWPRRAMVAVLRRAVAELLQRGDHRGVWKRRRRKVCHERDERLELVILLGVATVLDRNAGLGQWMVVV